MRADDLRFDELLSFRDGVIDFQGRRLVLHSTDAFAQFRKDLFDMVGSRQARRILTRYAYFGGQADAAAMRRVFTWSDVRELVKAGPRLHAMEGVARWVTKRLEFDEQTGHFLMEVTWHGSGEAEEHMAHLGKSEQPVCWMLAGYASGFMSYALGHNIYFVEQTCRAQGGRVCTAVGKDAAAWEGDPSAALAYFSADDIKGKIRSLTEQLRQANRALEVSAKRLSRLERPPLVEARSSAFARVLELCTRIAPFDSSVLITGESGVGKEVVARLIHDRSSRSKGPFLAINCGALPETLLDSELFGHRAGAFTGAVADHAGLFESAAGGTLFLDEIGEISHATQVKLLRVLQEREIRRVGENRTRPINVRVLAATNRDLAARMASGAFREDLYYRLRVVEVAIPPLRERREDILPLARFFVDRLSSKLKLPGLRLSADSIRYLIAYPWPGNVRELENAIEHAAVLSRDGRLTPELLPPGIVHPTAARAARGQRLDAVQLDHIREVLRQSSGNRRRAAATLGISTTTLWRKLKQQRGGSESQE
ncbi:MAG: sigma 54-interacting transcriptional regulator [Deltaproteobacteria bacterium]|nr:sigma 54-interacting transcriptional regulator [Deltaproteobacteria bacterium]